MEYDFKRYNDTFLLHQHITAGDYELVKSFLKQHLLDKHFYDKFEQSAAAVALQCNRLSIYELLIENNVLLGPHEQIELIVADRETKIKLRDIHRSYSKDPNEKHLKILAANSRISHEDSKADRREFLEIISEAFEDLNELQLLRPILQVVSTVKKLLITFDFKRSSVERLDPCLNKHIAGVTYSTDDCISIGASELVADQELSSQDNEERRCKVLGTLIHELCHYAIDKLNQNACKPYRTDEYETEQEFSAITNKCEIKKSVDVVIKNVFDFYPVEKHHVELIVRCRISLLCTETMKLSLSRFSKSFPNCSTFMSSRFWKNLSLIIH